MNKLPLRIKVEVIIIKDKKICLCTFPIFDKPGDIFYGFPGGGVDGSETQREACIKECLEEVGIAIKNITSLDHSKVYPPLFNKPGRVEQFSGTEKHFYYAEFNHIDNRLFNSEGDGVKFRWVSPEKAIPLLLLNKSKEQGEFRVSALKKLLLVCDKFNSTKLEKIKHSIII